MTIRQQPGFGRFYSVAALYGECWYGRKVVWSFHQTVQHGIWSLGLLLVRGPILLWQVGYLAVHLSTGWAESTIHSIF